MGRHTKWAWPKLNHERLIRRGRVRFDIEAIPWLNDSELVELLRLLDVRAWRGQDTATLQELLLRRLQGESVQVHNPIDELRNRLYDFVTKFQKKLRDQMIDAGNPQYFAKHDVEVLIIYELNRRRIEQEREHG